jgi:hypothetical protein
MGAEILVCIILLILSMIQLIILVGISLFLVRFGEYFTNIFSTTDEQPTKVDNGLVDVTTSQVPYNRMDERPIE